MKSHPGIAATMFETLADEGINIDMISTSTIRTSCIVRRRRRRAGGAQPPHGVRPGLMAPKAKATRILWLLRHAKAVTDPPPGGSDFDRVLAPRGRRDAAALGRLFAGQAEGSVRRSQGVPCRTSRSSRRRPARRRRPSWSWPTWRNRPSAAGRRALRRRPRGGARLRPGPARRRRRGHGGRAQPDRARPLAGPAGTRSDKKGRSLAVRHGFPTCALGVYAFERRALGGRGGRHAPRWSP